VRNLQSPVKVIYDQHAYWGTSHWGPKRQHFYFAANTSLSKDVYSRKRIIVVTRLSIKKKYDYGHLEEIEVHQDDQNLYKFREDCHSKAGGRSLIKCQKLPKEAQPYQARHIQTKATTYEIKWIEDLVRNLQSPVKVIYDQHAYWGTSHWGPKRQHFYFAANTSLSKDVYSRKRIIVVTRLSIKKKYDYGHLEEIEVHQDDQNLYKFREGDFPRPRLQDIEDMLLLLIQ
nr:hypothetical protein [Tanacetum cinerariifolium]